MPAAMTTAARAGRGWLLGTVLPGLPLSGFGDTLGYLCRYGTDGLGLQAEGVHAYFPRLLGLSGTAVGVAVVAGLLLSGLGRWAVGSVSGQVPDSRSWCCSSPPQWCRCRFT